MYDFRYDDSALTTYSLLRRGCGAINRLIEAELLKVGLTPEQLGILWTCRDNPQTMSITELALTLFRSKPSVTELVKRMERDSLVERVPKCPGHPFVEVKLTAKGEEVCSSGTGILRNVFTDLMSALTGDQKEQLQSLIHPLLDRALELLKLDKYPVPGLAPGDAVRVKW